MSKVGDITMAEKPKSTGFIGALSMGVAMKMGALTVTWFAGKILMIYC